MKFTYKKRRDNKNKKIKKSRKSKNINYRGGGKYGDAITVYNKLISVIKNYNKNLNKENLNNVIKQIEYLNTKYNDLNDVTKKYDKNNNKNNENSKEEIEELLLKIKKLLEKTKNVNEPGFNTKIDITDIQNATDFAELPGDETVSETTQLTKKERQDRYNELLQSPKNIEEIKNKESENIEEIVAYNKNTENNKNNININYLLDFIKKIQKIDLTKFLIKENLLSGLNEFNKTLNIISNSSNIPDKIKPNINKLIITTNNLKNSINENTENTENTRIEGNEMVVYNDNIVKIMNEINTILNNTITEIEPFIEYKGNNNITTAYDTIQFNLTLKNPEPIFDEKNKTLTYNITSETQKGGCRKKHTIRRNKNHKSKHSKKRV